VFELADVFILPSREEPLGLVCLEAAQCGLPVVCFGGAGGAPEFVRDDSGLVVPHLDVDAMAGAVANLLQDSSTAHRMGDMGRRRVADLFTVEHQAPRLLEMLQRTANLG
jgi:glycosyltransferase involved in cell wall biosynthesis